MYRVVYQFVFFAIQLCLNFKLCTMNFGEIRGRIPARFWPPQILLPGENLAGILVRILPGRKIPAAKISPGSWWDSRRDRSGIPPRSRSLFYKGILVLWTSKIWVRNLHISTCLLLIPHPTWTFRKQRQIRSFLSRSNHNFGRHGW